MASNDWSGPERFIGSVGSIIPIAEWLAVLSVGSVFQQVANDVITERSVRNDGCYPSLPVGFGITVAGIQRNTIVGYDSLVVSGLYRIQVVLKSKIEWFRWNHNLRMS